MTARRALPALTPLLALDAVAQVAEEQSQALKRHGKRARRENDPEAVHQMRVATRRMRTALRALRGYVVPPPRLRRDLKWLAGALGRVRDRDVILALMRSERLPATARDERARLAAVIAKSARGRDKAMARLREKLKGKRYRGLTRGLADFAAHPGTPRGGDALAARALAEAIRRLGATLGEREGMTAAAPSPEALHALRIDFKRLRYALDFHASACGLAYDAERRLARAMQDVLGDLHDRDLLRGRLEEGRGAWAGPWPALTARLTAERARLMRRFLRLRREWTARTRPDPTVAPLEAPRFVNLEVQPVTLRLVTGPKHVASSMVG